MSGKKRLLGPNHADTLTTVFNLASLIEDKGKLEEAKTLLLDSLVRIRGTSDMERTRWGALNVGMTKDES